MKSKLQVINNVKSQIALLSLWIWQEKVQQADEGVSAQQLQAKQPVGLAIGGDKVGMDDRQCEQKGDEGVKVEGEGLPNDPAHNDYCR